MIDMTPLLSGTKAKQIVRATVLRVCADGTVSCRCTAGGARARCEVLHSSDGPPLRLAPGDAVLVWLPGRRGQGGVVLGRIGPGRAPAPEPTVPRELVVEAGEALVLRCGEGSITLRADGKILIKGQDLVSHARRMNRIKGGSVAIN
jgi:hypothetical protein